MTGVALIDRETDRALFRNAAGFLPALPEEPALALRMLDHLATLIRAQPADESREPIELEEAGSNVIRFTVR